MREAILSRHSTLSPPATCAKNECRQPIDAIFVTPGLQAYAAGYFPFGEGCPSDHRLLWLDLTFSDAFGYESPVLTTTTTTTTATTATATTTKTNNHKNHAVTHLITTTTSTA